MSTTKPAESRGERIQANCKIIWGADKDFDLNNETDDYEYYQAHVQEDRGDSFGIPLVMTMFMQRGRSRRNELDRMLAHMARSVQSEQTTTKKNG
jgi:hypothetical protein